MKKKLLLGVSLLLSLSTVKAQWVEPIGTWSYGFKEAKVGTFSTSGPRMESISPSKSSFLPTPSSGFSKVFLPENSAGSFVLNNTDNSITLNGSTGGTTKFSVYTIKGASAIARISFNVVFSNPQAQNTTYYFSMGSIEKGGSIYNGANSLYTGANSNGTLFNALGFMYGKTGVILNNRTEGAARGKNVALNGGVLAFDTPYKIELCMNNSLESKRYQLKGKEYTVVPGTYHLWVTDDATLKTVQYTYAGSADIVRSIETNVTNGTDATIPANRALNSFLFQSVGSSVLKINGDIKIEYGK